MRAMVRSGWLLVVVLVAAAIVTGFVDGRRAPAAEHTRHAQPPSKIISAPPATPTTRPNIVFVLTDDLSTDLVRYMPNVQAMERAGMSFSNYTVTDSLCCPSRASIFTGEFPHDTGVFKNSGKDGGFHLFHRRGEESSTFATALQSAGYRTALFGKYLNGYDPAVAYRANGMPLRRDRFLDRVEPPHNWVPPGWTTWDAVGDGYGEFDYAMSHGHQVTRYGNRPADYGVDVISRLAQDFVTTSAQDKKPFFLEAATFAPHGPFVPAPRDAHSFDTVKAPRGPQWDRTPAHAPQWLTSIPRLSHSDIATIEHDYRQRVRSVQSVDRMIGALYAAVRRSGQADNTIFVFSSDNGFHMGQYRMTPGKLTAFDTDVNVPLVVTGPGIRAGAQNRDVVQNTDLAPTFVSLAGGQPTPQMDGLSMVPLLHSTSDGNWPTTALIEHHTYNMLADDPDVQTRPAGMTPSYEAMRTASFTYVRYADGEREYYDRVTDPYMLDNIYATLPTSRVTELNRQLDRLQSCHGSAQCVPAEGGVLPSR